MVEDPEALEKRLGKREIIFSPCEPFRRIKTKPFVAFRGCLYTRMGGSESFARAHPSKECSETLVAEFMSEVPSVGTSTENYFEQLQLRPASQIIDEALFYQTTTKYFKLIAEEKKENTSPLHSKACIQRDLALNWLLTGNNSAWDTLEE